MGDSGFYSNTGNPVFHGRNQLDRGLGGEIMPLLFATLAGPLAKFAEGAFLGVSVYLASKEIRMQ